MDTVGSPKTLQHSCSARVFQTLTNRPPGNTWITSQLLPTTKFRTSLPESYKKRIGKKPMLLGKAPPSISFQWRKLWTKNAQNVVKRTTQRNSIGQEEKIGHRTKEVQKVRFVQKKENRQKGEGQRKGIYKCQCFICTGNSRIVSTIGLINRFLMLWGEWKSWMVFG